MDWRQESGSTFLDRADAGRNLAAALRKHQMRRPIVLALPRGGVAVGFEIANDLGIPLDIIVARKLGAPQQPELAIGAVAPGGVRILDEPAVHHLRISSEVVQELVDRETIEMQRRERLYRAGMSPTVAEAVDLADRTIILVDDGIATGLTVRAAILSVRRLQPSSVIVAAPVCARETALDLRGEVDAVVCLLIPAELHAIGLWYRDFSQLTDDEVIALLRRSTR
jgi:predicted phosphoribosyltransferase